MLLSKANDEDVKQKNDESFKDNKDNKNEKKTATNKKDSMSTKCYCGEKDHEGLVRIVLQKKKA